MTDEAARLAGSGLPELYNAAQAVVEWADDLGLYADEGAELAPVLKRLKTAVSAVRLEKDRTHG